MKPLTTTHRRATSADCVAVHEIFMDASVNPYLSFEIMPLDDFRPLFEKLIRSGLHVVEIDGAVAAAYVTSQRPGRASHCTYIGSLGVHPAHQGKGLGTQLMRELLERLRCEGAKRIELFVEVDNPRAIALYKKLGFEIEGTARKLLKRANEPGYVDDYLMALLFD